MQSVRVVFDSEVYKAITSNWVKIKCRLTNLFRWTTER
jgi:hypothetical protein